MKKLFLVVSIISFCYFNGESQTSYKDVAPIFYANCTQCHNQNGVGPMPLLNYSQVYLYKSLIRKYVSAGLMPPWPPDTLYRHFFRERVLTSLEVNKIINWIDSGAVSGDTALAPIAPVYSNSYQLHGTPDLILKIPTFTCNAGKTDAYDCFVLPTGLTRDRVIRAFEIVPGDPSIVHHVIMRMDTSKTAVSDLSGSCFGMPGHEVDIGNYAPGAGPTVYPGKAPLKIGFLLKTGSNIVLQIHYPAGSAGKLDSTQVRIFFYPVGTAGIREIYSAPFLQNWKMEISPNTISTYTAIYPHTGVGLTRDISLYAAFPHQHKVGVSIVNYAYNSVDTIPLIRITNWNFRWQGYYTYPKLVRVPRGYTLFSSHLYNNTVNNPNNPFSPPEVIKAGEASTDEMLFDSYQYLPYQQGDDTINIDNILSSDTLLAVQDNPNPTISSKVYPNPFESMVHIGFTLNASSNDISINIYSITGAKVKTLMAHQKALGPGYYESVWDGTNDNGTTLPTGVYIYSIVTNKINCSGRLLLTR